MAEKLEKSLFTICLRIDCFVTSDTKSMKDFYNKFSFFLNIW